MFKIIGIVTLLGIGFNLGAMILLGIMQYIKSVFMDNEHFRFPSTKTAYTEMFIVIMLGWGYWVMIGFGYDIIR